MRFQWRSTIIYYDLLVFLGIPFGDTIAVTTNSGWFQAPNRAVAGEEEDVEEEWAEIGRKSEELAKQVGRQR